MIMLRTLRAILCTTLLLSIALNPVTVSAIGPVINPPVRSSWQIEHESPLPRGQRDFISVFEVDDRAVSVAGVMSSGVPMLPLLEVMDIFGINVVQHGTRFHVYLPQFRDPLNIHDLSEIYWSGQEFLITSRVRAGFRDEAVMHFDFSIIAPLLGVDFEWRNATMYVTWADTVRSLMNTVGSAENQIVGLVSNEIVYMPFYTFMSALGYNLTERSENVYDIADVTRRFIATFDTSTGDLTNSITSMIVDVMFDGDTSLVSTQLASYLLTVVQFETTTQRVVVVTADNGIEGTHEEDEDVYDD